MAYEFDDEVLPYTTIGTDEAKRLIESGAHVIDVRQQEEWDRGHIAEAELLPISGIYTFGKSLHDLNLSKEENVIFVCASGQRSASASEIASLLDFKHVYNLANGMHGWLNRGYPVER